MLPKALSAVAMLFALCFQPSLCLGQTIIDSPDLIIRKAIQNFSSRVDHTKNYAYQEVVALEWNAQRPVFNLYENMLVNGKPLRKHIGFNGQTVPPESADDEWQKIMNQTTSCREFKILADKVEKTTEAAASSDPQAAFYRSACVQLRNRHRGGCTAHFARRLYNMSLQLPIEALVTGFDLTLKGTEVLDGRASILMEAMPTTAGGDGSAGDLGNFKLRIWIDQAELEFAKLEGSAIETRLLSTADYFAVDRKVLSEKFVAAVQRSLSRSTMKYGKGTTISLEWRKVNGEAWLPTKVRIRGSEIVNWPGCEGDRVYFVSETPHSTHIYQIFGEYKKFRAETRIIGIDE